MVRRMCVEGLSLSERLVEFVWRVRFVWHRLVSARWSRWRSYRAVASMARGDGSSGDRLAHEFGLSSIAERPLEPMVCGHPRCDSGVCRPVYGRIRFGDVLPCEEGLVDDEFVSARRSAISRLTGGAVALTGGWGLETLRYGRTPSDDLSQDSMVEVYVKVLTVGWCPTLDDHWVGAEFEAPEWRWSKSEVGRDAAA